MKLPKFPSMRELPLSPTMPVFSNAEALPFVKQGDGIEFKLLQINHLAGTWVSMSRIQPGTLVPTHRHSGQVIAYTLKGEWQYLEHDFIATPGSLVCEPAGSFHTLVVPQHAREAAEVLFFMSGGLTLVDDAGEFWGLADAETELASYVGLANSQDLHIPEGAILVAGRG